MGLVFSGRQWVENISGSRNEMSNRSRKVQMPNKYLLNKIILMTVESLYLKKIFGNELDFPTIKSPELFVC